MSKKDFVREYVERLTYVTLQVNVVDRWVWRLHSFQRYTVKSAYNIFTNVEIDFDVCYKHVLRIKLIRLKINIFV